MNPVEIEHLIGIGFCQPKFYKRQVWAKAKKIMLWLVANSNFVEHRPIHGGGHFWTTDSARATGMDNPEKLAALYTLLHHQ